MRHQPSLWTRKAGNLYSVGAMSPIPCGSPRVIAPNVCVFRPFHALLHSQTVARSGTGHQPGNSYGSKFPMSSTASSSKSLPGV